MQGKRIFKSAALGILIIAALGIIAVVPKTDAQTITAQPQFLITWRASNSYVPPTYIGKILPNQASQITASVELWSQGQLVDLTGQTIYWFLNDNPLGGGIGAQSITFPPYGIAPDVLTLKVELPDYPGGLLIHEISIPVVGPQAVIEAPYPQNQFSDLPLAVQALPYFFNATSAAPLSFTWTVNGQTVSTAENPQTLQVSLPQSTPSGYPVAISLAIQNAGGSAAANSTANLAYERRL